MSSQIHQMTSLLPEGVDDLQDLALEVLQKSSALGNRQHSVTLDTLRELLRVVNSYYSNLIEGHNTHPYDIVRAMQKEYDSEPAKRDLQMESVAHLPSRRNGEEIAGRAGSQHDRPGISLLPSP